MEEYETTDLQTENLNILKQRQALVNNKEFIKTQILKCKTPFDGIFETDYAMKTINDPFITKSSNSVEVKEFCYEITKSKINLPCSEDSNPTDLTTKRYEALKDDKRKERFQLKPIKFKSLLKCYSLLLKNASKFVTEDDICIAFKKYGKISSIRIEKSNFTAASSGIILITYLDDLVGKSAIESVKDAIKHIKEIAFVRESTLVEEDPTGRQFADEIAEFHKKEERTIHITHAELFGNGSEAHEENNSTEEINIYEESNIYNDNEINPFWYSVEYSYEDNSYLCRDKEELLDILYPYEPDKIVQTSSKFIIQFKAYDDARKVFFAINKSRYDENIIRIGFEFSKEDLMTMEENLKYIRSKKHLIESGLKADISIPDSLNNVEKLKKIALNHTKARNKTKKPKIKPKKRIQEELELGEIVEDGDSQELVSSNSEENIIENNSKRNDLLLKTKTGYSNSEEMSAFSRSDDYSSSYNEYSHEEGIVNNNDHINTDKRALINQTKISPKNKPSTMDKKIDFCSLKINRDELLILNSESSCMRTSKIFKLSQGFKKTFLSRELKVIGYDSNVDNYDNELVTKFESNPELVISKKKFVKVGKERSKNSLRHRQKKTMVASSGIHGTGLYTMEKVKKHELIIEYVGEIIGNQKADDREEEYLRRGIDSSYMFRLNDETVIDSTFIGNKARFINHSCLPNSYARKLDINGTKRIVIYANKFIPPNQEITYDYQFAIEEDADKKIPCLCGAPNCKKYLN